MWNLDQWQEISHSIRKHKLRTFLTGFGVAWGIFMLVILLGTGKGLEKGVSSEFEGFAQNSLWIWGSTTSLPHKGLPAGRLVKFDGNDIYNMKQVIPGIRYISQHGQLFGADANVYYQNNSGTFNVKAVNPDFAKIKLIETESGRLINQLDYQQQRKVVVIGEKSLNVLFGDSDPLGEFIKIKGEYFRVIGVLKTESRGMIRFGDEASDIYIPYTTFKLLFNPDDKVSQIAIVPEQNVSAVELEGKVKHYLANRYNYDPEDPRALWVHNWESTTSSFSALFTGINIFLWIVGISTLVGGIVGVSNIMLVTVRERTREIGIRKALGATPSSIVNLIIQESIIITVISGYIGLVLAALILRLVNFLLEQSPESMSFIKNPTVDINIAIAASIVLIFAGALAGFIPARKASKIHPIEALRYE